MKISSNFNRLYWKTVITDIKNNLDKPIEMNHHLFGYIKVNIKRLSKDSIHQIFKQLTNYPKNEDYKAKSLTEITSKDLVNHIEEIKVIMLDNGFTFNADELSWNRLIEEAKKYNIK